MVERTPDEASKKPAEEGKKIELMTQKQIPTDKDKKLEEP
jgi:hypothetical protein